MAGIVTYGDISPRTAAFAVAKMLVRAVPYLVLEKFMQMYPIPSNSSKVAKFRRYEALPLATTPLVEGVTPQGKTLTYSDVECTLSQYGDYVPLSDVIADTHEDPVFTELQGIISEQAAQTIETIRFNIFKAGTNVYYANGASRGAVNTALTVGLQRKITRGLQRQNAAPITKVTSSSPNYGTQPCEAGFVALCHVDLETDIRGLSGFVNAKLYTSAPVSEHELGSVERTRYVTSTIFQPWAGSATVGGAKGAMVSTDGVHADVYPILYLSQNAIAGVPLKGKDSLTPIVLNPKPQGGDPLGQRGYVGWKAMTTAVILNQSFIARAEVACTEL